MNNLKLHIEYLGEPEIEVGRGLTGYDPKRILPVGGPLGMGRTEKTKMVRLGLVALLSEVDSVQSWIDQMHGLLIDDETNARRFHEFPGLEKAFHSRFEIPDSCIRVLDENDIKIALELPVHERFSRLLTIYTDAIDSLFVDQGPDCILVCFPEGVASLRVANPGLTYQERRLLERMRDEDNDRQLDLFEPTPAEKKAAEELIPQADDLLFRNFHRALKARCMLKPNCVPLQVLRRHTYIQEEAIQSRATRAWNLAVAVYYKAGNIPWKPHNLPADTCFVGISFHHLKRRSGDIVYSSLAQAFSNEVEPFALKGESVPRDQVRHKRPYLTERQSALLAHRVLEEYKSRRGGTFPQRVVTHKTSRFEPEEIAGFQGEFLPKVSACDLVWLVPTGFRLLRRGVEEPLRGTLCTIADEHNYLFTTGYVRWWHEYPGPHIPSPLQIGVSGGQSDVEARAREILALTKMNWNSADGIGRNPITLSFARRVGITMTEIEENETPNPLYRFYM
jgi:hypothetical protein